MRLIYNEAMSKVKILLISGVWVAVLPYLGFPIFWKNILFSLSGLGLVYMGYAVYEESKKHRKLRRIFENFQENRDFSENASSGSTY